MSERFPPKRAVWIRAILGGIVNATKTAEKESYACFEGWNRNHYVLNGVDGRQGIITFAGGHWYSEAPLVGVFHDVHSPRYNIPELDLERFFHGCPAYQRALAEQDALSFLKPEHHGSLLHHVTAAFWDDGESLAAADPWGVIVRDGASLISEEMTEDRAAALERFAQGYGMTAAQLAFAASLCERKIARPPAAIELTIDDRKFLESTFKDPKVEYAELERVMRPTEKQEKERGSGAQQAKWWEAIDTKAEFEKAMKACREKFAEIGIYFS